MQLVSDSVPRRDLNIDCYVCQYREVVIPGNTQVRCNNQRSSGQLGIVGIRTGRELGEFNWPHQFEPVWLVQCNGFKEKKRIEIEPATTEPDVFDEFMSGIQEVAHDFREWWGSKEFWSWVKLAFGLTVVAWSCMFVLFMGGLFLLEWKDYGVTEACVRFAERNPFW